MGVGESSRGKGATGSADAPSPAASKKNRGAANDTRCCPARPLFINKSRPPEQDSTNLDRHVEMLSSSFARSITARCIPSRAPFSWANAAAVKHASSLFSSGSRRVTCNGTAHDLWLSKSSSRKLSTSHPRQTGSKEKSPNDYGIEGKKTPPIEKQVADLQKTIKDRVQQNLVHENIYTLPNILTFSRLISAPVIGYLVLHGQHAWAVGLFCYAGVTDLVDGWIARRWNLQTVVGTVIDPLADKLLMTVLTVCLAVKGGLPMWLATVILGRDVSLAIAAIYYRFASLPPPKTLARYWDFSLPSAEVHPTGISKANTFLQLLLIGAATAMPIAAPTVDAALQAYGMSDAVGGVHGLMTAAQYLVAATTVWSGASYLYTRNAVKILNGDANARKRILVRGRTILGVSFACCLGLALAFET